MICEHLMFLHVDQFSSSTRRFYIQAIHTAKGTQIYTLKSSTIFEICYYLKSMQMNNSVINYVLFKNMQMNNYVIGYVIREPTTNRSCCWDIKNPTLSTYRSFQLPFLFLSSCYKRILFSHYTSCILWISRLYQVLQS